VISSEPGKGTELKSGTSVDLVLSKGATPIEIPDVADSSVADATEELEGTGFKVKSATKGEFSADVEKGDVIRTDPTGTAPKGDRIRLVVSKGPKMISVPDVVGEDVDDARDTLEGKGFEVNEDNGFLGLGGGDTVKSQTPAAGEEAAEGSEVTIETE
jgi:serine/threonine-protein kinase